MAISFIYCYLRAHLSCHLEWSLLICITHLPFPASLLLICCLWLLICWLEPGCLPLVAWWHIGILISLGFFLWVEKHFWLLLSFCILYRFMNGKKCDSFCKSRLSPECPIMLQSQISCRTWAYQAFVVCVKVLYGKKSSTI